MDDKLKRFEQLKGRLEQLEHEKSRAEGVLDARLKELQDEFGIESLADARKLLKKIEAEKEDLQRQFDEAVKALIQMHPCLEAD